MSSYNPIEPPNGDYEALIKNLENQKINKINTKAGETISKQEHNLDATNIKNSSNTKTILNQRSKVNLAGKNDFDNKKFFKAQKNLNKSSNDGLKKIFILIAIVLFIILNLILIILGNALDEEFFFFLSACSFIFSFAFINNYKQRQRRKNTLINKKASKNK